MGKPSVLSLNFQDVVKHTGDGPNNVRNVGRPSISSVHYEIMKELTLERNHTNVKIIGKPSIVPVLFKTMKTLIMERRPMNVRNVGEPSIFPVHSEYKK